MGEGRGRRDATVIGTALGGLPELRDRAVQRGRELAPGFLHARLQFAERGPGGLPFGAPLLRETLGLLLGLLRPAAQILDEGAELSKLRLDGAVEPLDEGLGGGLGALGLRLRGLQGFAPRLELGLDLLT